MTRIRTAIGGGVLLILLIAAYMMWPSAKPIAPPTTPVTSADGGAGKPSPSPIPSPTPKPTLEEPGLLTLAESQALRDEVLRRYAFLINNREGDKQLAKATYDYLVWEKKKADLFQGKCCPDTSDPGQEVALRIQEDRRHEREVVKILTVPARPKRDCSGLPEDISKICNSYH